MDVTVWHGINFHKNNLWNILIIGNYYVNFQIYQNWMRLSSSDTRRTLMQLFLFINSTQRELITICTKSSILDRNQLALVPWSKYILPWFKDFRRKSLMFLCMHFNLNSVTDDEHSEVVPDAYTPHVDCNSGKRYKYKI